MSAEGIYEAAAAALLAGGGVEPGRLLKAMGLKSGGKFFAMFAYGELVVKLPKARAEELVAGGRARYFERGPGRPLKEWVSLPLVDEIECATWMAEAREHVGGLAYRR